VRIQERTGRYYIRIAVLLVLSMLLTQSLTFAEDEAEAKPAVTAEAEVSEQAKAQPEEAEKEAGTAEKPEKPKKIPLNLKNSSIDQVIKFLSDNTGKVVVKSKDVQAQITIVSPKPVTPQRAVELICHALRLEGVALLEQDEVIKLVPAAKVPEMGVVMVAPGAEVPESGVVRKIIDVRFADVTEIQDIISPLLPEGGKVVADPRSQKLIITAAVQDILNLEKVIGQLDVLQIQETQVRVFQLKFAVAEEIAPIIEAILRDAEGKPPVPGKGGPPQKAAGDEVTVVPYKAANWLLVRAPKEKLDAAEGLIGQLDKEKPPELDLNVILIKHADASELARQLSDLFRKRPQKKTVRDAVEFSADQRSNSLIVLSSAANFELVKGIIAELDTEESRKSETRFYELNYADAEDMAEQLNELYSGLQESPYRSWWYYPRRRQQQVETRFVAERRTNTLIVIADPSSFEQIGLLIQKLDRPISESEVTPRIYPIRNIDAKELTDVLNETFGVEESRGVGGYPWYRSRAQAPEVGRLYGKVRFIHEPATNSVIVITNNQQNFPIIERLIGELDRTTPELANTMVYELENADAAAVADQLNTLFALPGAGRPAEREEEGSAYISWLFGAPAKKEETPISNLIGKVRVVPDTRTNSLLITTAVQHFEVLRQLIKQLDVESPKVLVEVRLIEIIRSSERRIGTRFSSDATIFDTREFNQGLFAAFGFTWEQVASNTVLSADVDLAALIQFLQRNFEARVLSQPTITVNNNKEANIFVGSEVPYIKESQGEPGTTARNVVYDYKKVGTDLTIKPHINRKNKVVITVNLTSSQIREGEVLYGGFIEDKRSYDTELAVDSGQTVVIGGILRQEEGETFHRVPILGYIPVLNLLFSKKDKVITTTELIAFITPRVLRTRQEDDEATREERRKLQGLNKWPPGEGGKEEGE